MHNDRGRSWGISDRALRLFRGSWLDNITRRAEFARLVIQRQKLLDLDRLERIKSPDDFFQIFKLFGIINLQGTFYLI